MPAPDPEVGAATVSLEAVGARRSPLSRASLTCAWGPGVHSIVGAAQDGGPLLLELIAGWERPRAGRLEVLGGSPRDPEVRRRVALAARTADLPTGLRVRDVLALAASLRAEPDAPPGERLALLGVEALADRAVRSLSPDEARAVALAEALSSTVVRVALVEEPRIGLDPRAAARLREVLRARATQGWTVIVATASVRDAGDLCDDHVLLRQGAIAGEATSLDALSAFTPGGARMRALVSDPHALVVALAQEADVASVARSEGLVLARAADPVRLAQAIARAVQRSGVALVELRLDPPTVDEARSAASGVAQATFEAARSRTLEALADRARGGTS